MSKSPSVGLSDASSEATKMTASVDDPVWLRARYEEAKELVSDLCADISLGRATVDPDIRERAENFWTDTFMDRCTTMGLDCGCNTREES